MLSRTAPGPIRAIGKVGAVVVSHTGAMGILTWRTFAALFTGQVPFREFVHQLYAMGVQSIPLVMVTSVLSGIVTSQQGGYQFTGSIPLYVLGSVVTNSIALELAPVLTAVVVIGRVGARITAEIGTMQVSEQIDALYSLWKKRLEQEIEEARYELPMPFEMALIHAQLGEKDVAFEYLDKAIENRIYPVMFLRVTPDIDPLRADPRFADALRRVGLLF